jgi:hypothetical protein
MPMMNPALLSPSRRLAAPLVITVALALVVAPALAARPKSADPVDSPPLWGLGVKGCDAFLTTAKGWDQGVDADIAEYSRYQDWISGFISGLNLATGDDVLRGAGIDGAMRQVRAYCTSHREADFFNATMGFVRSLSTLR